MTTTPDALATALSGSSSNACEPPASAPLLDAQKLVCSDIALRLQVACGSWGQLNISAR